MNMELRFLVVKIGDIFKAVCLELSIEVTGITPFAALNALGQSIIMAHDSPFKPAPAPLWKEWSEATPIKFDFELSIWVGSYKVHYTAISRQS